MNMQGKIFEKAYVRDFSIIMEEAWYDALSQGLWKLLGVKPKEGWPNFYYFNRGIIEVWDNKKYIRLIKDAVFRKNGDGGFFNNLIKKYKALVRLLKDNKVDDGAYIKALYEAIGMFSIFWYGIQNNRMDKKIRKTLVGVRDADTIFDSCDALVRKRIIKKYPKLAGVHTAILKDEFLTGAPTRSVLKKRLDHFILVPGGISAITTLEKFARKYRIKCEMIQSGKDQSVRGTIAFPGNAIGKARIIRRKDEIVNMKKGEVLISPMTTPDAFPIMPKACAIVTDEGGQLCHAAIVSRELKIPCIIGTKIATQVFKDGDMVEVDAINGIVRKI